MKPALTPLETLYETEHGKALPLPPRLARLYGRLRMTLGRERPYIISNFVTTLDGVVSLNEIGHASGGDISGFSSQDRMVMGLLRAIADVVVVGAGTLGADRHQRRHPRVSRAAPNRQPDWSELEIAGATRETETHIR